MSQHVIKEIMSMVGCRHKMAKDILNLSKLPIGEIRNVGARFKKRMLQHEAVAIVNAAKERMALVDEGG